MYYLTQWPLDINTLCTFAIVKCMSYVKKILGNKCIMSSSTCKIFTLLSYALTNESFKEDGPPISEFTSKLYISRQVLKYHKDYVPIKSTEACLHSKILISTNPNNQIWLQDGYPCMSFGVMKWTRVAKQLLDCRSYLAYGWPHR